LTGIFQGYLDWSNKDYSLKK